MALLDEVDDSPRANAPLRTITDNQNVTVQSGTKATMRSRGASQQTQQRPTSIAQPTTTTTTTTTTAAAATSFGRVSRRESSPQSVATSAVATPISNPRNVNHGERRFQTPQSLAALAKASSQPSCTNDEQEQTETPSKFQALFDKVQKVAAVSLSVERDVL